MPQKHGSTCSSQKLEKKITARVSYQLLGQPKLSKYDFVAAHLKELERHSLSHGLFGGKTTAHVGTGQEAPQTLFVTEINTDNTHRKRLARYEVGGVGGGGPVEFLA